MTTPVPFPVLSPNNPAVMELSAWVEGEIRRLHEMLESAKSWEEVCQHQGYLSCLRELQRKGEEREGE